jgi:hypothetical protein
VAGAQSTYRGRVEIGGVSALSAGAHSTTLHVMVDIVKGAGVRPLPPPAWANFSFVYNLHTQEQNMPRGWCNRYTPSKINAVATISGIFLRCFLAA